MTVAFVGPLPPPVHGFANICGAMLERLRERSSVAVLDRAPVPGALKSVLRQVRGVLGYGLAVDKGRDDALYIGLSGGRGQLFDLMYAAIGRIFHQRTFIHHHSFAYLRVKSGLTRLLFRVARGSVHVVLSEGMGELLVRVYGIDPANVRVLSNASFMGAADQGARMDAGPGAAARTGTAKNAVSGAATGADARPAAASAGDPVQPLRIGYLSNITFEKGIVEYFEILLRLRAAGVPYSARVAGPVAPETRAQFDELLAATGALHLGPLYGPAKDDYYRDLDILLFPSRYPNEAEPLVILEAMRAGVHVVASDIGAIAEVLRDGAGLALRGTGLVDEASAYLALLAGDRERLAACRRDALARYEDIAERSTRALEDLLGAIAAPSAGIAA